MVSPSVPMTLMMDFPLATVVSSDWSLPILPAGCRCVGHGIDTIVSWFQSDGVAAEAHCPVFRFVQAREVCEVYGVGEVSCLCIVEVEYDIVYLVFVWQ